MADYAIPKSGVAYIFYTGLVSQADTKLLKSAPTIAAGDFKLSIDGGAFANLTTLPTNTPGGTSVKISLSSAEMTGDNIQVACIDAAGAEWCDQTINIQTSPVGLSNLATPTNITAGTIASVTGSVGSVVGAVGSVTTAITLPTIPTDWITANGIATDAIGSAEVSAAAVAKIQAGLATPTNITAATGIVLSGVTHAGAVIPTVTTLTGNTPQTGDTFARLGVAGVGLTNLGDARLGNLDASISSLNNLSALMNIYGSPLLEIPDTGSTIFAFTLVVRDNEGKLVTLDAAPTITAANAAGTSRSANLSSVFSPATGRYTFTYSVSSAALEESLRITCTGAVSSEGRYIEWIGAVVNYDTLTTLAAIQAKTDLLPASPAATGDAMALTTGERSSVASAVRTNLAVELGRVDVAVSTRLATSGYTAPPSVSGLATATALAAVQTDTTAIKAKTDNLPASPAATGDAMSLTSGERTSVGTAVWASTTRTLSSFGTLVSDIWAATTRTLSAFGFTVAPTAAAVAAAVRTDQTTELGRIDAAISSRLATSGYTAPTTAPTAATNASQVRTELAIELARIDVATSTRLATAGYTTPPTAAENATQTRTELGTELARIDVAVSTRLATSAYTAPPGTAPSAAAVAAQVRTELTTELGRIDATVSSRLATAGYTAPPSVSGLATSTALAAVQTDTTAIKAKTDNLPASPASTGAAMTLTTAYDAAKTAAPTASDNAAAVRTNLTTELGRIDGAVSTRASQTSVTTAQVDLTTLTGRLSATRAGYLDNLSGGTTATQADINALNQSASRRIIMTTLGQYERPESSSISRTVEIRTYDPDGAVGAATGTPTLTATGSLSGSLAANVGAASNPALGVYRWEYTIQSNAVLEQVRFDVSAVVSGDTLPMSVYAQVLDYVSTTFTTDDRTKIVAIFDKLPVNIIADQTLLATAITALNNLSESQIQTLLTTLKSDLSTTHGAGSWTTADISGLATQSSLDAVKVDTGNLTTRIGASLFAGVTSVAKWWGAMVGKTADGTTLAEINATTAGAGYDNLTDSLQAIRDRGDAAWVTGASGGGLTGPELLVVLGLAAGNLDEQFAAIDTGSGDGPYLITGVVRDASTLAMIQGATVRVTRAGETARTTTDVDGAWGLSLSAATYTLLVARSGYVSATPQPLIVTTEQAVPAIGLEANAFTPSEPDHTTGTITVFDIEGEIVAGASVTIRIIRLANGVTGIGIVNPIATAITDSSGFAQFPGLPRLALYESNVEGGALFTGTTLDAAETPLKGMLGLVIDS